MTTIDDKLKLFARVVFEKVEKDSQQRVMDATKSYDKYLDEQKTNVLKESDIMVKQMKKKAEYKKEQIISKANIDRQHVLLKKKKELFDRTMEDIRSLASSFTHQPEYMGFLEKSIKNGLSKINSNDIIMFFTKEDIDHSNIAIKEMIDKYKEPDMKIEINETDKDILGGCVIEDREKTIRVDCSFTSIIDDNRVLIGKILMDNLEQSR